MKAKRIRVIKDFQNKRVGNILDLRMDIAQTLVNKGLCEWAIIEVENETPVIEAPIIIEPVKPVVYEPVEAIHEPIDHNDDLGTAKEKRKRIEKPKPKENKQYKPVIKKK